MFIKIKNRKIEINFFFISNYKKLDPDFEQRFYSRTAKRISRIGKGSIRSWEWMTFFDRYGKNINDFDSMASISSALTKNK